MHCLLRSEVHTCTGHSCTTGLACSEGADVCRQWHVGSLQQVFYLLEMLAFMIVLAESGHGSLQCLPGNTLASACLAHNHVSMAGHFTVKDLDDLGHKCRHHLQAVGLHLYSSDDTAYLQSHTASIMYDNISKAISSMPIGKLTVQHHTVRWQHVWAAQYPDYICCRVHHVARS